MIQMMTFSCRLFARRHPAAGEGRAAPGWVGLVAGLGLALLAGCRTPMGADLSTPRTVYAQSHDNVLNSDQLSSTTQVVLRRFDQTKQFTQSPDATIQFIHQKAVASGEHDLLFALSELSYLAGERMREHDDLTAQARARDYYLACVIYAWFFLFDGTAESLPGPFDNRFRLACDLYNFGLVWALTKPPNTEFLATFQRGIRHLPVGEVEIEYHPSEFSKTLATADHFVVADKFLVRGLSVRNRRPGLGAPLVAVTEANVRGESAISQPATVLLRIEGGLAEMNNQRCRAQLELYSSFETESIQVGNRTVPLAADTTVPIAYGLNQEWIWGVGRRQFRSAEEEIPSNVYLLRPYRPGAIPLVLVHGTFSSPIWWAEMINTLSADPVLAKRFQIWHFIYNSGNPVVYSAVKLRESLTAKLQELDPEGLDPALKQMVVVGHSQGGLLTKLTATDTGDSLTRVYNHKAGEEVKFSPEEQALIERYLRFTALPFVTRVVFISTPHRGSYHVGGFLLNLSRRLVTLPGNLVDRGQEISGVKEKLQLPEELQSSSTSLNGMSPNNPLMLKLADMPIAPGVTGHSIIAIDNDGDIQTGNDGIVSYQSAHVDYVASEFIVRAGHSCQDKPATIEEVRRILYEHLRSLPAAKAP